MGECEPDVRPGLVKPRRLSVSGGPAKRLPRFCRQLQRQPKCQTWRPHGDGSGLAGPRPSRRSLVEPLRGSHPSRHRQNWRPHDFKAISKGTQPFKGLRPLYDPCDRNGPAKCGVPTGIRTPVAAVKGRCPRPLDDGDQGMVEPDGIEPSTSCMPCKRSPS